MGCGGSAAPVGPDAAPVCAGTFSGTAPAGGPLAGQPLVLDIAADGTFTRTIAGSIVVGHWSLTAGTFAVQDDETSPMAYFHDVFGQYALTQGAGCASVSLAAVADPCDPRRLTLDGFRGAP